MPSWWETYLANETLERAQARAQGYSDVITRMATTILKMENRLWDAQDEIKRLKGLDRQTPVAPAPVVA